MTGTTNYPAALDSAVTGNPEGFAVTPNFKSTTLNGAHNAAVTTFTVISTTGFPTRGLFSVDTEVISYTGVTATTFTGCTRGVDSTAATHNDLAEVAACPSSRHHDDLAVAIVASETKIGISASTPTAGTVLRGTGAGSSAWGAVVDADVSATAEIAVSKLADGAALAHLRTASDGVTVEWSGAGQIAFPAAQNASADANTLDDYEEGTWTPNIGGNATYTSQLGFYRKVGSVVHVWFYIKINVLGTGSVSTVSGLPFTSGNNGISYAGAVDFWAGLAVNVLGFHSYVVTNSSSVRFAIQTAAGVASTAPASIFGNAAEVEASITYTV